MLAEAGKSKFGNLFNLKNSLLAISILLAGFHLFLYLYNHYCIRTATFDLGVYNFAFYDYAHFRVSPVPFYLIFFDFPITFLQDHFSLTLMLFLPFYWLLSWIFGSYTLLIVQWCFVTYGAWATYKLVQLKTQNTWLAPLSAIYYFLLLGRYTAIAADINLVIIGSAMVPPLLYFFEKEKYYLSGLCFLFLVFNREDYPMWLFFIGIFLVIIHRKDRKKLCMALGMTLASVVFFVVIFKVFIPMLEDENKKYSLFNFTALGKNPAEALSFVFHNPVQTIKLLFTNQTGNGYYDNVKKEFYIFYLFSGGILLLIRPAYIIPFIPLVAKKMFSDDVSRWSIEYYYCVEICTIMPLMVFMILADFKRSKLSFFITTLICAAALFFTWYGLNIPDDQRATFHHVKGKTNFFAKEFYHPSLNASEIHSAMSLIPDTAAVSANGRLAQYLAFRKKIYYFPKVIDASYIMVTKSGDSWPLPQEEMDKQMNTYLTGKDWHLLKEGEDFYLFKKANFN